MGLFSTLFGDSVTSDPTINWPMSDDPVTPDIDLEAQQIGPIKFRESVKEAHCLGRPESSCFSQPDYLELIYARAGFALHFDRDRLDYVAFYIAPDEFVPDIDSLRFCEPMDQAGHRFSDKTTEADLVAIFGRPTEVDRDSDETIVNFVVNGLQLEFELNPAGKLKRWICTRWRNKNE